MNPYWKKGFLVLFFLLLAVQSLKGVLFTRSKASLLKEDTCYQADFREQHLTPSLYEAILKRAQKGESFGELLTATMLQGHFSPKEISRDREAYVRYKPKEYAALKGFYEAVWADVRCFPIPADHITYEDSFGEARDFGGSRLHEGCDLFGRVTEPGYYPVVSMTDGKVEKIGWLPLGGYRIGIRAPSGGYFYYAHLSDYEKNFRIGEMIEAGDILGYMGDTGYGEEGTRGQFPVHLHLGIYLSPDKKKELSVNPYWVLRAIDKNLIKYKY